MLALEKTPYSFVGEQAEKDIAERVKALEERVSLLRASGALTEETIRNYYGEKRFEQVAESNAIEGSTLSAGETELAVLKGVTITGHDPAYIRDAISLDKALQKLVELAKAKDRPTDISQLHTLHGFILGDRPGGGVFRKEEVILRGSAHVPPRTWNEIMKQMEKWEEWSLANAKIAAPVRAAVLHAWLTHIHPYIDGNGRLSRAVTNLELVRAGYPPIIIKKKERDRYIESLGESDVGGDIRSFFELVLQRLEGALTGLELSAKKGQHYDPAIERIKKIRGQQLYIWNTSVQLLASTITHFLSQMTEKVQGTATVKVFEQSLDIDDYTQLCDKKSVSGTWAFTVAISIPGFPKFEILAYIGFRSSTMFHHMKEVGGPSVFWSVKNPNGFPKWIGNDQLSPRYIEMTTEQGNGDNWHLKKLDKTFSQKSTTALAADIAVDLFNLAGKSH